MDVSSVSRSTRSRTAVVGGAVAATAAVTALGFYGVARFPEVAPEPVAAYSPTDTPAAGSTILPVAVPTRPCAGSYWSTQAAGAAAPAVRPASAGGP